MRETMRNHIYTNVIFITLCFAILENFQRATAFDDVETCARSPTANRVFSIVDSGGYSTGIHQEQSGSRKRSREYLLEAIQIIDSISTAYADRLPHDLFASEDKKAKMKAASKKAFLWYLEASRSFDKWKSDFLELSLKDGEREKFEQQMNVVTNCLSHLSEQKPDEIREWRQQMWLKSIAEMSRTWENLEHKDVEPVRSIIHRGSDLMIDCFIDLARLEIITPECLSRFLNTENRGQVIVAYVNSKFSFKTLTTVYPNLNLKLSLQESPCTLKMAGLLKYLNQETWERIEFDCLKARITSHASTASLSQPSFASLRDSFLESASPDKKELRDSQLESFMIDMMIHVSSQSRLEPMSKDIRKLSQLKHLYDMWGFINRYCGSHISQQYIRESRHFIRLFEEAIGLLSSVIHSILLRKKAYQEEFAVRGLAGPPKVSRHELIGLMDSNQENTRKVSYFNGINDQYQLSLDSQHQINYSSDLFEFKIKPQIPQLSHIKPFEIENSIEKVKDQYRKFYIQLKILETKNPPFPIDNCFQLVLDIPAISVGLIRGFEASVKKLLKV
ncbi:hypothetical protein PSTT_08078 [Puccinia striiformis]|uniref:Uncharacterized protein n=2 Tax=Puccinia striiformis TaxID=27350 RepID=A0A2S4VDW1_9BASI|nr:hypothetical protein PSTT_08078 [Puccinia striiformis]